MSQLNETSGRRKKLHVDALMRGRRGAREWILGVSVLGSGAALAAQPVATAGDLLVKLSAWYSPLVPF